MIQKRLKYILLLLSILLLGCTKENTEECFSGLHLRFRFTLHEEPQQGNLFGQNVGHVRLFVFDEDGVLRRIQSENGAPLTNNYVMSIDLDPGRYSIVAWATDNTDFFRTHLQLHSSTPQGKELEVGVTRLEDFRIMLDSEEATIFPEDVKPKIDNFDDLYFGAVGTRSTDGTSRYTIHPVEVKAGEYQEREVELIRNTNIVRITIEGVQHLHNPAIPVLPQDMFEIWATANNVVYHYDNVLSATNPLVRYLPQFSQPDANTVHADVKIERLEWQAPGVKPVNLTIKLKGGKNLYVGDLVALLRQAKDSQGNSIYKNQEDLDRIYLHPIRFVILDGSLNLSIKIFIHNWEVITVIPEF